MSKFKPHQLVRVKYFIKDREPDHWTPIMMSLRGNIVRISRVISREKTVTIIEMPQYFWYESDFEKVNTNAIC